MSSDDDVAKALQAALDEKDIIKKKAIEIVKRCKALEAEKEELRSRCEAAESSKGVSSNEDEIHK